MIGAIGKTQRSQPFMQQNQNRFGRAFGILIEKNERDIVDVKVRLNKHLKEWNEYKSFSEMTATNNFNKFEAHEK